MSVTIQGSGGVTTNSGAVYDGIQSGTAVTASGTSVNFTGIPSWVKRITVMFNGVSTSGTSFWLLQLGDSGGIENTGYTSYANTFNLSPSGSVSSAGFLLIEESIATGIWSGILTLCNVNDNLWVETGSLMPSIATPGMSIFGGNKTLSDPLTQIRITTANGTDTFDAGSINILYE
jgi:hypothetical protein